MPWNTPITWTNITLTAANLNTLRDNVDWLGITKPMWYLEATGTSITTGGGYTNVTYPTEGFDTQNLHSTVTNTDRVTIATAGKYLIIAYMEWAGSTAGQRDLAIRKNAGGTLLAADVRPPGSSGFCAGTITWFGSLAAADYVNLGVAQNSGVSLTVRTYFAGFWVGT